ncbi:MAG: polysaccharide deacetylase family protein [Candidatus Methylumidiphilus sp.]
MSKAGKTMVRSLYRIAGNALSPQGEAARLSILIYHRVLPNIDDLLPYEVTADAFDKQLEVLKSAFNVLSLGEAVDRLKLGTLPPRSACITFDDGYADNATIALPILQRHGMPATFFIASAYINGGIMFNDVIIHAVRHSRSDYVNLNQLGFGEFALNTPSAKRLAISRILFKLRYETPPELREDTANELAKLASDAPCPTDLMMGTRQLLEMANAGMEIGGHTLRHPILARLSLGNARREIADGKDYLEALLGIKLNFFAYPNGRPGVDYTLEQAELIPLLGFAAALTTSHGTASQNNCLFELPRFTPHSLNSQHFVPALLKNIMFSRFNIH